MIDDELKQIVNVMKNVLDHHNNLVMFMQINMQVHLSSVILS